VTSHCAWWGLPGDRERVAIDAAFFKPAAKLSLANLIECLDIQIGTIKTIIRFLSTLVLAGFICGSLTKV
jgi:hypothetical protein